MQFFRDQDVRFRIRRLRFLARRLAEDVEVMANMPSAIADRLRQAIYASLSHFLDVETADFLGADVAEAVRHGVENPAELLNIFARRRNLEAGDSATDAAIHAAIDNPRPLPVFPVLSVRTKRSKTRWTATCPSA